MIKRNNIISLGVILTILLVGCKDINKESLLPKEIVSYAMEENENIDEYYMKSNMKMYEMGELTEEIITEEWTGTVDGEKKRKVEIVSQKTGKTSSLADEETITMYQEKENQVFSFKIEENSNNVSNKSLKERAMGELDLIKNLYEIENLGEEKVNGKGAYHIKGHPKKENSLFGAYEVWIDKENWVVLKSISSTGDIVIETENLEVDISPKLDESIFKLDIPEDAETIDMNTSLGEENIITIEQAREILGEKVLYIDDEEYNFRNIKLMEYGIEDFPDEIIFQYTKKNNVVFEIGVFKKTEDTMIESDPSIGMNEEIIRGNKGIFMDNVIKLAVFYEDGLQYSFIVHDENKTKEEVLDIIENMVK